MAAPLRALIACVLLCGAGGCIQDDGRRFDPVPGRTRMSVDAEREIGWDFDQKAQAFLPLVTDLEVLEFLDDLGNFMVEKLGDQPFDYRFRIVVSPELNAFAVPGGYIYFHTGTLLSTGDVEELAGVLAHELAHVKGHHHARMAQDTALPNLLTSLAGVAAGAATGSAGPMIAAQGLNVALQLQFTRQYEDEADRVGATFLNRAGWKPDGMVRFFERILLEKRRMPAGNVPAYLFSHPQVETRIDVVRGIGEKLAPTSTPPARFEERFREMQARLAVIVARGRVASTVEPYDRAVAQPLLDAAAERRANGDVEGALAQLVVAEEHAPNDPRVPVLRGEILQAEGRPADAAAAFRRAVYLDPNPPAVLLALARAHADAGDRRAAIFFTEQAIFRSGARGTLRQQAERSLERLIFPVIAESGFGAGRYVRPEAGAAAPRLVEEEVEWWARLGPHYVPWASYVRVRWIDPEGAVVRERKPRRSKHVHLSDALESEDEALLPGAWRLEVLLGEDVVHTQPFELVR